ncbi:kynureninase [Malassezia sp. CBS 17886]|nr:kynureninase [Malassezia sp. CBS 17886]
MSAHQALQSTLLRLCVLSATSVSAAHASYLPVETVDATATMQDAATLSKKLYDDLVSLLLLVQKDSTALALAMRPAAGDADEKSSPLDGVDDQSIEAATKLLHSLSTECIPKLVFLANLALKNSVVCVPSEDVDHDEAVSAARAMGAHVVPGDSARGKKVVRASLGTFFAQDIRCAIAQVSELVAQLCQSFMDARTRAVLERAQVVRDARERQLAAGAAPPADASTPRPTRAASLALTKQLWTLCEGLTGTVRHGPAHIVRLPRNNREAVLKVWKQSETLLEDSFAELQEAIRGEKDRGGDGGEVGEAGDASWAPEDARAAADAFAAVREDAVKGTSAVDDPDLDHLMDDAPLTDEERVVARSVGDLLSRGFAMEKSVRASLYAEAHADVDFDEVGKAIGCMAEAQDELVATVLGGEETPEGLPQSDGDAAAPPQNPVVGTAEAYVGTCNQLTSSALVQGDAVLGPVADALERVRGSARGRE